MKPIAAVTIPHEDQRDATVVGDCQDVNGMTIFTISKVGVDVYEHLILLHALVEKIVADAGSVLGNIVADKVERTVADTLGVNWADYKHMTTVVL